MSGKNGAAERERSTKWSTAKLTKSPMQRPVLEDLGSWAAETKHPREKPHGEVRSAKTQHETHCEGDNEHNSGEGYPTPPNQTPAQCVCLQANMNVIIPDPTPPNQSPTPAQCVCFEDERYYPTPPNQSPTPAQCVCLQANMNVITQPHPTPPHQLLRVHTWDSRRGVVCACAREPKDACAGQAQTGGRSLLEDGVGKRCTRL